MCWLWAMVLFLDHEVGVGFVAKGGSEAGPGAVTSETGPAASEGATA